MKVFIPRLTSSSGPKATVAALSLLLTMTGPPVQSAPFVWSSTTAQNWSVTTAWTPNGTPGAGDDISMTSASAVGNLQLAGTARTINSLTKTGSSTWVILGNAAALSTLNVSSISTGTANLQFRDGASGGGLQVNAGSISITTGGQIYFGTTSNSAANLMRGVAVSGTTTIAGTGFLRMNVVNSSGNSYSLGLVNMSDTSELTLANAPTGKAATIANVSGLNGSGGVLQANLALTEYNNMATLAINNSSDYSSGTVLRDGIATTHAGTLLVTKAGAGIQTFTGANSYTGATTITNGVLKMGSATALGGRSGIVVTNTDTGTNVSGTGTLDLGGQSNVTEVIRISGTGSGGNGALINTGAAASISSGVASITQTTSGTTAPTITLTGGGGTGATATLNNAVTTATFTINGGTTVYSVAPTVTISGGGASTAATATAILNGSGVVTGISIATIGIGYTSAPNITFSGGTITTAGTNPTGTGNAANFMSVGYNITNAGSGYTSAPVAGFSNGSFAATASLSGVVLTGNSSIGGTGDITLAGVLSESGGSRVLTKVGSNTLTLSNSGNSYTGGTIINGGSVAIPVDVALGTAPGAAMPGHLTLNGGGLEATASFTLNANRGISLGASGGTLGAAAATTLTYGGIIADGGALTKTGAGTLVLSGLNTYSGGTVINAGTLSIAADSALGAVPGAATPGNLTLNGGALATTVDLTLNANRGVALGASGGGFDVAAATTLGYSGNIAGAGGLTKSGTGALTLSTAHSHAGTTAVSAGTLVISHGSALGTTAGGTTVASGGTLQLSGGITVSGEALSLTGDGATAALGALLSTGGSNVWSGNVTVTNATRINADSGSLLISGDVAANGTGNFTAGGQADIEISGVLSGSGMTLFKASVGAGSLTLSNAGNTFTGSTTIGNGMVVIATESALGVASAFVASKLRLRGGALRTTADTSISVNRGITLSNGGGALSPDSGTTLTVNSLMAGTATDAFVKTGGGRVVMTAANTYAGTTEVVSGSLQVGQSGAGRTGTGTVTARTGSTILGTGVLRGLGFVAESGSTVHAGDDITAGSFGTLTFTPASGSGSFDFQSGSSTVLGLNPGGVGDLLSFDGLSNGTLLFNGDLQVLAPGYTPISVESFNLLDWANLTTTVFASRYSSGSYGGYLLGNGDDNLGFDLPDIGGSGYGWDISNFVLNGSISTVLLVPEPGKAALCGMAMVMMMGRRRRAVC